MKLWFWAHCMDLFLWLGWQRAWDYALVKASEATDWGPPLPEEEGDDGAF